MNDVIFDLILFLILLVLVAPVIGYVLSKSKRTESAVSNTVFGATDGFQNKDKQNAIHYVIEEKSQKMEDDFTYEPYNKAPK